MSRSDAGCAPPALVSRALDRGDGQGLRGAYSVVVGQHQAQLQGEFLLTQGATGVVRLEQGPLRPRARRMALSPAPNPAPSAASTSDARSGCAATPHG
jgi:hypothetical protein